MLGDVNVRRYTARHAQKGRRLWLGDIWGCCTANIKLKLTWETYFILSFLTFSISFWNIFKVLLKNRHRPFEEMKFPDERERLCLTGPACICCSSGIPPSDWLQCHACLRYQCLRWEAEKLKNCVLFGTNTFVTAGWAHNMASRSLAAKGPVRPTSQPESFFHLIHRASEFWDLSILQFVRTSFPQTWIVCLLYFRSLINSQMLRFSWNGMCSSAMDSLRLVIWAQTLGKSEARCGR